MSQHCSTGVKGKVIIALPNKTQENVISNNCPLEVIVSQGISNLVAYSGQIGTPCFEAGSWFDPIAPAVWVWNSFYASPQANSNETASFTVSFEGIQGQSFGLNVAVDNVADIFFNGATIGQASNFSNLTSFTLTAKQGSNILTFNCTNTPVGTTSPTANPAGLYFTVTSGSCGISVRDTTGEIYNKQFGICPTYEVVCGDECPPGYLKCKTTSYPGYCCIPCSDVLRRINNLSAKLP